MFTPLHMSCVMSQFFFDIVLELVGKGLLSTKPTLSSFYQTSLSGRLFYTLQTCRNFAVTIKVSAAL